MLSTICPNGFLLATISPNGFLFATISQNGFLLATISPNGFLLAIFPMVFCWQPSPQMVFVGNLPKWFLPFTKNILQTTSTWNLITFIVADASVCKKKYFYPLTGPVLDTNNSAVWIFLPFIENVTEKNSVSMESHQMIFFSIKCWVSNWDHPKQWTMNTFVSSMVWYLIFKVAHAWR